MEEQGLTSLLFGIASLEINSVFQPENVFINSHVKNTYSSIFFEDNFINKLIVAGKFGT